MIFIYYQPSGKLDCDTDNGIGATSGYCRGTQFTPSGLPLSASNNSMKIGKLLPKSGVIRYVLNVTVDALVTRTYWL